MAHIRQARPDSGVGFCAKVLNLFHFCSQESVPQRRRGRRLPGILPSVFFFITVKPDTQVYEPQIRALLGTILPSGVERVWHI